MPEYIAVNHSVCTGCRECEMVCSLYHYGECNPERSAIRVIRREKEGLVMSLPLVCQQCINPACAEACPVDAISRDGEPDVLTVDWETCTGCEACMDACPAGCIFMDIKRNVAISCDLCGGEPQCVVLCHSNCLTLSGDGAPSGDESVQILAEILEKESLRNSMAWKGGNDE